MEEKYARFIRYLISSLACKTNIQLSNQYNDLFIEIYADLLSESN